MPPDDPADDDLDLAGVDRLQPDQGNADLELDDQNEPDEPDDQDGEGDDDQTGDRPDDVDARGGDRGQPPADQKPPPRRDRRIQALNDRLRERDRQIDELIRQRAQPAPAPQQPTGESEAQRTERRSRLTPEERISEDLRDSERRVTQQLQGVQLNNWDTSDRALYETRASIDPLYKRWKDRVEQEVGRLRERGQVGVAREAIFYYLIGKAMAEQRGTRGNRQQRRAAERNVARNVTRPSDSRSNAQPNRRGGGRSLEERLADVPL